MYSAIHWFGINRNLFLSNLGLSWVSIILTFHNLSTPRKCQSRSFRRRSADTIPSRAKHNQKKVFHNIVALLQLQNVGDHWEHVLCWFWPRQDRCLSGWSRILRRWRNENNFISWSLPGRQRGSCCVERGGGTLLHSDRSVYLHPCFLKIFFSVLLIL